jgi:Dinucleotide-utilizing enzymes involved in molybdopterin and thiamine biosynthesis family 2
LSTGNVVDYTNITGPTWLARGRPKEGKPKALACQEGVKGIDGSIRVEAVIDDVDSDNVEDLVRDVDIALDGTDNLETRFLVNEAAVKIGKPWVYAGVNGWYGTVMFISPRKGPCLRCFMSPEMAQNTSCDIIPTIGTVTTITGSVAAGLALRYLAGDEPEPGELILISGKKL